MQLKSKFNAGEFVILAEIEPPKGVEVSPMIENAKRVKGMVDAFIIPEMSNAVMRMSSLGGAMILQAEGLETIMQVNCRDRNRIALQADLLAANGCGIENVMAVTGEDPGVGDHHKARSVHDLDLLELLQVINTLQNGKDMAGIELAGAPRFQVGSTVNLGAKGRSPEIEIKEMNQKFEAGAEFFITPPLFDISVIEPFLQRIKSENIRIIPTVLLLKSLGMARYIAQNLDHVFIPDSLIDRLRKTPDKVGECVRIAGEMIQALKSKGFSGVLVSSMGWEHKLPDVLNKL